MSDTTPIMEAVDLRRHYEVSQGWLKGKATVKALDGVSFQLWPGKTLAVVGESGCGKSTLARQLLMIEDPTEGHLEFGGHDMSKATSDDRKQHRRDVQMIFQDPFGSLNPRKKVGSILTEPLLINTKMTAKERETRAKDIMARVGLRPEQYDRYPHMFSGGQRQRIAVARSLMLNPKIIVADEPVSALDVSIQAQVLNLLLDIQQDFELAYVFISHDLSVVRFIANEVMVMYLGRPVEQAPTESLFRQPLHPYTKVLISSTPKVEKSTRSDRLEVKGEIPSPLNVPDGCAFHTRCPYATGRCGTERPRRRRIGEHVVVCHHAETIADGIEPSDI